jgi:chromosome segregation ATPase
MPEMNWISVISDYGGVMIGLVLLLVATHFLPGKIRMYVLTAGIALLIYRIWQIYSARKELAEADNMREQLRAEGNKLKAQLADLEKEAASLRDKKVEIELERDRLKQASAALDTSSSAALEEKRKLDAAAEALLQQGQDLHARSERQKQALDSAAELAAKYATI